MTEHTSPSSSTATTPIPPVFVQPGVPPRLPTYLRSSQDLLDIFNLHPAYEKYVRPSTKPLDAQDTPANIDPAATPMPGPSQLKLTMPLTPGVDKGKGRQVDTPVMPQFPAGTPAGAPVAVKTEPGADSDDDGVGGKKRKKEKSYRHLIRHLPGKHTMKKDAHFMTLIQAPPKQRMAIQPFDQTVLMRAFNVKDGGLPGYNKAVLIGLDDKEKELKKRKKEERRAAKERARLVASGQLDPSAMPPMPGTSSAHGNVVLTGTVINRPGSAASTPRPQVATPSSRRPSVPAVAQQSGSRASTPKPIPPRLPSVKAETPGPSLPTPARAGSVPRQQQQQQQQQQQAGASGSASRPSPNRPGSAAAAQRAAQQQPQQPPRQSGSGGGGGPRAAKPQQQQQQQQQSRVPSQQGQRPPARPPGATSRPTQNGSASGQHQQQQQRGTIRKERDDDIPLAQAARGAGGSGSGGPRPAKKQRVDGGGPGPGIVRKQQPTPQTS